MKQTTHLVWRIENTEGIGPYSSDDWWTRDHNNNPSTPSPMIDGLERMNRIDIWSFYFGFKNINQLCKWFTSDELTTLDKRGFKCRVYVVPTDHYEAGKSQVAFQKCASEVKQEFSLRKITDYGLIKNKFI